MLNISLSDFSDLAEVSEGKELKAIKPIPWESHAMASEVIAAWGGKQLSPKIKTIGSEILFCASIDGITVEEVDLLRQALKLELFPIAIYDSGWNVLFLAENGECFSICLAGAEVFYLGELRYALRTILMARAEIPVFPRRSYVQAYGPAEYPPGSPNVYWVDSDEWYTETRVN